MADKAEDAEVVAEEKTEEVATPEVSTEETTTDEGTRPQFTQEQQEQVSGLIVKAKNKLKGKIATAEGAATEQAEANVLLTEENRLLKLANEQARGGQAAAPNPDDYDLGEEDPVYQQKTGEHTQAVIQGMVNESVAKARETDASANAVAAKQARLAESQNAHYERVKETGNAAYFEREDAAINILGLDNVNVLIQSFPDAHNILHYLGTPANAAEAQKIAGLLGNPDTLVMGISEIGALRKSDKMTIERTVNNAPDPDEEIKGDGSVSAENYEKLLDKFRTAVSNDPTKLKELVAFKKKHLQARG